MKKKQQKINNLMQSINTQTSGCNLMEETVSSVSFLERKQKRIYIFSNTYDETIFSKRSIIDFDSVLNTALGKTYLHLQTMFNRKINRYFLIFKLAILNIVT